MKIPTFLILVIISGLISAATGDIWTTVYLADGNTPLELADPNIPYVYKDIMVGTRLTIVVSSDIAEYWSGGALVIEIPDMNIIGRLYGRDCDRIDPCLPDVECLGSCLPAAGEFPTVWSAEYPGPGFLLCVDEPNVGDWFILDYNALDIGDCNVAFYDYERNQTEPVDILAFHHVRTRDFDNNTIANFSDYAILASYWQENDCSDPDFCQGTDLNTDGCVDYNDLMLFAGYWLEMTRQ